jgi:Protein of unknown function (DUF2630)
VNDQTLQERIEALVAKEHALYDKGGLGEDEQAELRSLEGQLDRLWDLLRQRRAKREYGQNPDEAEIRSLQTVEGYTDVPQR